MSGTKTGGSNAAQTMKERYGENYYREMGRLGGSKKVPKGFALNPALAREAGAKGGRISKRGTRREPVEVFEESTPIKKGVFARFWS